MNYNMKHIKSFNESIKDVLKPKSEEDIKNALSNLDKLNNFKKINYIVTYNLFDYVSVDEIKRIIKYELDIQQMLEFLSLSKIRNLFSVYELSEIKDNIIQIFFDEDINDRLNFLNYLKDYNLFNNNELSDLEPYCNQNESIKNILKPKSNDDIEKAVKNLTPDEKILKGCENNFLWLVEKGIEEGGNPNISKNGFDNSSAIHVAIEYDSIDVFKFLVKLPEIILTDNDNSIIWTAVYEENIEMVKILLDDDLVLKKSVEDGDIDHFIELVEDEYKDDDWLDNISERIDNLSR